MDAAISALIGAGVGAIVPTAERVIAGLRTRSDAREARLFDHKRQAYAAYVANLRKDLNDAWEWHNEGGGTMGGEVPASALDALGLSLAEVSLYCTETIEAVATSAQDAVSTYVFGGGSGQSYKDAEDAVNAFVKEARKDLGADR